MSTLHSFLSVGNADELSPAMQAADLQLAEVTAVAMDWAGIDNEPAPATTRAQEDIRVLPEFVRDVECDIEYGVEEGEVELMAVRTLDDRDLLPELDQEERQYVLNLVAADVRQADERRSRQWWR